MLQRDDSHLHREVLKVKGFQTAFYIQRPQSPANRGLGTEGIPDYVLHRDDRHLHREILKVKGFRILCYTENTVTCKHSFRRDFGLRVTR